jgi:hypothetical protein
MALTWRDHSMTAEIVPPKIFHDLVVAWRAGAAQSPEYVTNLFSSITLYMPGYWNIVGVTKRAHALMEARGWAGDFTKGLRRDHAKSRQDFQKRLLDQSTTYPEFVELVADYGRCILCTIDENPPRTAGYGNTYQDDDVLWLPEPIETAKLTSVYSKKMAARLRLAREAR